jgi:hypothetical protein
MRTAFLTAAMAAVSLTAMPSVATAQSTYRGANQEYRGEVRDAQRDYRRDLRDADSRKDVRKAQKEYRKDVRDARKDLRKDRREISRDYRQYRNYDYNRREPGQQGYYADRYYRDGQYYQTRRLTRNDRIYRGENGRYYCRRTDGTTGLIVGGIAGGTLGNLIAGGGSRLLGTLIGAGGGALLGRTIDRGQVTCR